MSVQHVTLSAADEKYGPPEKVVTVTTAEGDDGMVWVFLDVDEYDETGDSRTHKTIAHVPPLRLEDLLRALAACEPTCGAVLSPYQLPKVAKRGGETS